MREIADTEVGADCRESLQPRSSVFVPLDRHTPVRLKGRILGILPYFTGPLFKLRTNNCYSKKVLGLLNTWSNVVKNWKILTFKVNFRFFIIIFHACRTRPMITPQTQIFSYGQSTFVYYIRPKHFRFLWFMPSLHNGRPLFIFITGLDCKKRSFEASSSNHSGIF